MGYDLERSPAAQVSASRSRMDWPEACTKIAFYTMLAVIMTGWPKVYRRAKASVYAEEKVAEAAKAAKKDSETQEQE